MLSIISYILKILFSLAATYLLVQFGKEDLKEKKYDILKYNFICIFLLSPIYSISIKNESFMIYSVILLLLFSFLLYNSLSKNNYTFLLSYIVAVLISANYILYSLFGVAFYLFFDNNLIDLLKDDNLSED